MRRIPMFAAVVLAAACAGGCSSAGSPSASGPSPSGAPTSAPTAPSTTVCAAVRHALSDIPKPAAGVNVAGSGSSYYTSLLNTFVIGSASDPASLLVTKDAQKLANDYGALYTAQSVGDAAGWDRARAAIGPDVKTMARDETAFDRACGVSGLASSPAPIGALPVESPSATPSPSVVAPAPEQVTYHCSGNAPDGVNITYGPNGTEHSASSLPLNRVEPLTDGALYYAVSAQLQGGGSVSCTVAVQTDALDGSAQVVSNSGSADGGYTISSAEVCMGLTGWERC